MTEFEYKRAIEAARRDANDFVRLAPNHILSFAIKEWYLFGKVKDSFMRALARGNMLEIYSLASPIDAVRLHEWAKWLESTLFLWEAGGNAEFFNDWQQVGGRIGFIEKEYKERRSENKKANIQATPEEEIETKAPDIFSLDIEIPPPGPSQPSSETSESLLNVTMEGESQQDNAA